MRLREFEAKKGAVYIIELHAADTNPGSPNEGLVDKTYIGVPSDKSGKGNKQDKGNGKGNK